MSSSEYDVVFNNALKPYKKKTGNDLASDPLLHRLETCNSPGSLLALLKDQIPGFDQSGNSDERLTKWVNQVVNVLYNFAATIGGAVSFVSLGILGTFICSDVYFLGIPTSGSHLYRHCLPSLGRFRHDSLVLFFDTKSLRRFLPLVPAKAHLSTSLNASRISSSDLGHISNYHRRQK
jgi:hypothetical protein